MLPTTELACFCDRRGIPANTRFVSGVELDHAQDIIADIMDTLVRALRPPRPYDHITLTTLLPAPGAPKIFLDVLCVRRTG